MKAFLQLFLISVLLLVSVVAVGQVTPSSDDPQYQTISPIQDEVVKQLNIGHNLVQIFKTPVFSGTTAICDSGLVILTVSGATCGVEWFVDSLATTSLGTNDTLQSGSVIMVDTTFYAQTIEAAGADSVIPLPAHSSSFSGNVRGYYFQAPTNFTITGFYVPTDASTAAQHVEVLRFNSGAPPLWSTTTNDFVSLGRWINFSGDTIPACIHIDSGDFIGIYGNRGDVNSYAPAPTTSSIAGYTVSMPRSGMQLPISSNAMQDVFSESGGSISRIFFFYTQDLDTTMNSVDVSVFPSSYELQNETICQGDSFLFAGSYYTMQGTYFDSTYTVNGCDSIIELDLTVDTIPYVTLAPFSPDTICLQSSPVANPAGTPSGGTYSGTGVSGSNFDPSVSGAGTFYVVYTYLNGACSNSDSTAINVIDCTSLDENGEESPLSVYPNPVTDFINIELSTVYNSDLELSVFNAKGQLVIMNELPANTPTFVLNVSSLENGVYYLTIVTEDKVLLHRFTK